MTIKELVSHIAKGEGKKSEVKVGDVREIVGILSDLFYGIETKDALKLMNTLIKNGQRRSKKKIGAI